MDEHSFEDLMHCLACLSGKAITWEYEEDDGTITTITVRPNGGVIVDNPKQPFAFSEYFGEMTKEQALEIILKHLMFYKDLDGRVHF